MVCNSNVLFGDVFAAQTAFHEVAWALVLLRDSVFCGGKNGTAVDVYVYVELSYSCGKRGIGLILESRIYQFFPLCSVCLSIERPTTDLVPLMYLLGWIFLTSFSSCVDDR